MKLNKKKQLFTGKSFKQFGNSRGVYFVLTIDSSRTSFMTPSILPTRGRARIRGERQNCHSLLTNKTSKNDAVPSRLCFDRVSTSRIQNFYTAFDTRSTANKTSQLSDPRFRHIGAIAAIDRTAHDFDISFDNRRKSKLTRARSSRTKRK